MAKQRPGSVQRAIGASLLSLAKSLDEEGKLHQALDLYFKVVERYSDSQEATAAAQRVLSIAEDLREKGKHHTAMTVLDRLEAAHQGP